MRRFRILTVCCVLALAMAGCGRDDESTEADDVTDDTEAPDAGGSGDDGGGPGLEDGAFGDLGVICQAAPEGETLTASDTGVSEDSVQVSTFSDPGFSGRLGLNQEMFDTAEAFAAWCNEHGGINGRQIDLKLRDAKLAEFQQRVIEACTEGDFMMVGGGNVFDDTGQADRLACGLPAIYGYAVTATASEADNALQPLPNPGDQQAIGDFRYIIENFPDTLANVGVFTGQLQTTIVVADRNQEAAEGLGMTIVYEGTYSPAGETSWRPFIEAMRSQGVRGVIWVGEPSNLGKFLTEAASIGVTFDWVRADANHYDPSLTENAGDAADGVLVRSVFYPFLGDEARDNPATTQYLDLMEQYKPDGKIAYLGVQGLSAWLLWAYAANECGAELTRDCVWEKATAITEWTGGGLHARADLTGATGPECYLLHGIEGGAFTLADVSPNEGIYNCDPENVYDLQTDYGEGAKCPNAAYADDPKPSNCA